MKLLFFGDLAIPDEESYEELEQTLNKHKLFKNKVVIGNLEGVITEEEKALKKYTSHLFNQKYVLDIFK